MIITAGESLIDLTPAKFGGESGGDLSYVPHAGGSPYNVAVALGRQRLPVAHLGRVSTDYFGRLLRNHLAGSGVQLDYLVDGDDPSTVAFVHFDDGEPEYAFYSCDTADRNLSPHDLVPLPVDALLHVGSISLVLEPAASTLEGLIHREHGARVISLDPNVRPSLIDDMDRYRKRFAAWTELVDLIKVSTVDLTWLAPGVAPADAAARWLDAGVSLVLVTDGGGNARAYTAEASSFGNPPTVRIADTVGAGDAFTAGVLAWLYNHRWHTADRLSALSAPQLDQLLVAGNELAAAACTRHGADPPWRS